MIFMLFFFEFLIISFIYEYGFVYIYKKYIVFDNLIVESLVKF